MLTYRELNLKRSIDAVECGGDDAYQAQIQSSYNTSIRLLQETADPTCAPDADLAALAKKVNDFLEPKAKLALDQKRAALRAQGKGALADKLEFTVLFTARGIQLAFANALERKEIAPVPRKSFLRRVLGPLYPNRKFWYMPATQSSPPRPIETVRWPWAFWIAVLLAILGTIAWFTIISPEASLSK